MQRAGVVTLLGATMRHVEREGRRIKSVEFATRYGDVIVEASGFIDASGDAAFAWRAGLNAAKAPGIRSTARRWLCWRISSGESTPPRDDMRLRMEDKGDAYDLPPQCGVLRHPGQAHRGAEHNASETPLEPFAMSKSSLEGKDQADRCVRFLREQFPECFGEAKVRAYGMPGIRQTRWIAGRRPNHAGRSAQRLSPP